MSIYKVHDIDWDFYDEEPNDPADPNVIDAPDEMYVECDDEDDIADTLSDRYGYCVKGYLCEEVPPEEAEKLREEGEV